MNQLDIFYRSYQNYKKELEGNREDHLVKKAAAGGRKPNDFVSKIQVDCKIDEDWIIAIEKSLPYLEKCIKEDRQFIKNNGEVLPIEKIRRVSKDSISDLAKHSDYITKVPEDDLDNVIPEKLLMISRESDYKIYENRVLYAALTYLRDFISIRLEKITEALNKYESKTYIKKKIEVTNRTVDFLMDISERRLEDPLAIKNNKYEKIIERIRLVLNDILVLLKTPLMVECSKAPLVTRPITKTNVLKMNINFKEALAVFDYVVGYDKDGYEIIEKEEKIYPLSEEQNNAFVDIIELASFLSYEYNNHLEEELLKSYEEENLLRKRLSEDELLKHLDELMLKAKTSEHDLKEYLYLLEEGTKILHQRLDEAKEQLRVIVEKHEAEIEELKRAHQEEMDAKEQEHAEKIREFEYSWSEKLRQQYAEFEEEKAKLIEEHNAKVNELNNTISAKDNEITRLTGIVEEANQTVNAIQDAAREEVTRIFNDCEEQVNVAQAEVLALRLQKSNPPLPEEFASKDKFIYLEAERKALNDFHDKAWVEAKREIRSSYFKAVKSGEEMKKPSPVMHKRVEIKVEILNEDEKTYKANIKANKNKENPVLFSVDKQEGGE